MKNVSKSGSSSETRASTKSSMDGLFCNMPAEIKKNKVILENKKIIFEVYYLGNIS